MTIAIRGDGPVPADRLPPRAGARFVARYLAAHFAKSQLWHVSSLFFAFFLTESCALDARTMGLVLAGSLVVNAVADRLCGRMLARYMADAAQARRFQSAAAPWAAIGFALFAATPLLPDDLRLGWAIVTLLGFRLSYPLIDVPQNALVALAAADADARCRLLAARNMVSSIAGLAVGIVAAPLLTGGGDALPYTLWAAAIGGLSCLTAWRLARTGDGRVSRATTTGATQAPGSAAPLYLALTVTIFGCALFRALEPYQVRFGGAGYGLILWAAIGATLGQPLWVACRRRLGEPGVLGCAALLLVLAALLMLSPLRTTPPGAAAMGAAFGAGTSGIWLMLWAAMATRAAAGQAMARVGAFTCVSKLAQAAAALVLGEVLAAGEYRDTLALTYSVPSLLAVAALVATALAGLALIHVRRNDIPRGDCPNVRAGA